MDSSTGTPFAAGGTPFAAASVPFGTSGQTRFDTSNSAAGINTPAFCFK